MKKYLFVCLCCLTIFFSYSQDIITTKSGEDIKAKVLEVNTTEIKFKKIDNIEGPTFSVLKSEILLVRYSNGTKDIFYEKQDNQTQKSNLTVENNYKKQTEISKKSSGFNFGIKGGLSYSDFDQKFESNAESNYFVGAFFETELGDELSLQPEMQLCKQGNKLIKLFYVNFPILLKYKMTKEFYLVLGPQIGFLSMENSSYPNQLFFDPFTGDYINNTINKTDFGVTLGVGCNVDHFVFDLRFYNGLAPITNYYRFKNSVIQASIGYKFL
jgi:hypothetical protein